MNIQQIKDNGYLRHNHIINSRYYYDNNTNEKIMNLQQKFKTESLLIKDKIKSRDNYRTVVIKNEYYNKIEDLASYYQIPKSRVLSVIISDAHTTIMKGNDNE